MNSSTTLSPWFTQSPATIGTGATPPTRRTYQRASQAKPKPVYAQVISATMDIYNIASISTESTQMERKTIRYTNDPEILAMSDEEYIAAVLALGGSCAGDNLEDSIEELNKISREKLSALFDDATSHPSF